VAKRAQEQAEQRYRALVQSSHCLACELDGDLQIVYASPNHKEILEYDPAVLMGQSCLILCILTTESRVNMPRAGC
jgi:PAS domain S-box-containing protein